MGTIESLLGLENIKPEDMVSIKQQLQDLNDAIRGGLRSANLKEYRNTYVINAQDSLDATYPMYVHFNIIPEMTKIVSIKLSFWFQNFRAYATGASSGGGATPTSGASSESSSASGGGETPTSSSGGASTPTSSSGGAQTSSAGGAQTSGAGGDETSGASVSVSKLTVGKDANNLISALESGYSLITTESASGLSLHTHEQPHHHHSIADHTHTVADHTHTVTIAAHTHTVTVAAHTHGIAHTHTVTIVAHAHSITYGIFEDSTSPTVIPYISRDNGLTYSLPIGSYTKDQENLEITNFIDTAGSKMIKFTSNARTRLSVQITITLDIKART